MNIFCTLIAFCLRSVVDKLYIFLTDQMAPNLAVIYGIFVLHAWTIMLSDWLKCKFFFSENTYYVMELLHGWNVSNMTQYKVASICFICQLIIQDGCHHRINLIRLSLHMLHICIEWSITKFPFFFVDQKSKMDTTREQNYEKNVKTLVLWNHVLFDLKSKMLQMSSFE